ncbi:hypothetical protein PM082_009471 [Marasmius tenuissimus]|nr:hypothetical protein PM082_009471 [Marasmius tenuissimus]
MLTLYDTGPSGFPSHLGCGPHVRKIIFALNYKKIPFKLVNVPFTSIETTAKLLGAPPTDTFPTTGEPKYTVPFLHDSDKNRVVSDSFTIAEYIDKAYPDTPRLFTEGTVATVKELVEAREEALRILFPIFMHKIAKLYSDEIKAVVAKRGGNLEATIPEDQQSELWDKAKKAFEEVEGRLGNDDGGVFADLALAGMLWHIRCACGEESKEWEELRTWAGGKMDKVTNTSVEYESQILSS